MVLVQIFLILIKDENYLPRLLPVEQVERRVWRWIPENLFPSRRQPDSRHDQGVPSAEILYNNIINFLKLFECGSKMKVKSSYSLQLSNHFFWRL